MTGRGIDQVLPHPSNPTLFESYVRSATEYVELAERATGPVPSSVDFDYVWGDALLELGRERPDARIVNLETAVTTSDDAWPAKAVLYRMHPANIPCLTSAHIDCCTLANNHVLDWGRAGLAQTLATLHESGIRTTGAGGNATEAAAPAIIVIGSGIRILVFAFAMGSSGVPRAWRATQNSSGVNWIEDLSARTIGAIGRQVAAFVRQGDIVVGSVHWGGNWGYPITRREREFAHEMIDTAGIDIVHGHSSHHVKGIELHHGKPILYGCGDLINDYEGIGEYETYHADLGLMYLATVDVDSRRLVRLSMLPTQIRHLRINSAPPDAADWLLHTLDRECRQLGTSIQSSPSGGFVLLEH